MFHDQGVCRRCRSCLIICPVGAIKDQEEGRVDIDRARCVECGTCARSGICPKEAFRPESLSWPRLLRALFSDPLTVHNETRVPGRGTEEMKTNDVTGRLPAGIVGFSVEIGRPSLSASFLDIQHLTMACASLNADFEDDNPITALMVDRKRGLLRTDILEERVLSALVEIRVEEGRLSAILRGLAETAETIDSVFSLSLSRLETSARDVSLVDELRRMGIAARPNGKMNVGLGRPRRPFPSLAS